MYRSTVFILVIYCFCGVHLKQIPSYIQLCKRDQNTIDDCVRHSVEALRPRLAAGLPELDVPGIDPFYIHEIKVTAIESPLNIVGKNVKVTGVGNFTIKSLSVDLDTLNIKLRLRIPKMHLDGAYKLDTNILMGLPIHGDGNLKIDAVKCDADVMLHTEFYDQNGVEYMRFTKMDNNINIKDYTIKIDGLFNGNQALGDVANTILNQNRGEFLKVIKPTMEKTVTELVLEMSNKIVDGIAYDDLFPKP
ncbi:putative beta-carotene-binding protein [Achroia grisella]|uniref:putative beta-carotene-binding protein n=1 Tax=Achroia grisella TaxID=688607 RepID=UPI0027D28F4E|nr:putative beta-carotene-binding protein [Achroia grisella]